MVPSPYSLDRDGGGGGTTEVATELPLLGDLLQQRVASDLPRTRPPQGHLAMAGGRNRHRRRRGGGGEGGCFCVRGTGAERESSSVVRRPTDGRVHEWVVVALIITKPRSMLLLVLVEDD